MRVVILGFLATGLLAGCSKAKTWYFTSGDSIHGPYTQNECAWMAGNFSRVTQRRASECWDGRSPLS